MTQFGKSYYQTTLIVAELLSGNNVTLACINLDNTISRLEDQLKSLNISYIKSDNTIKLSSPDSGVLNIINPLNYKPTKFIVDEDSDLDISQSDELFKRIEPTSSGTITMIGTPNKPLN